MAAIIITILITISAALVGSAPLILQPVFSIQILQKVAF